MSAQAPPLNTVSGDATGTRAGTNLPLTLATVNSNVGSFTAASITVNAKGLVTVASSGTAAPSAANPTGTIGLSAVNGSASTFLRSDGAPALSVTIVPTWTGNHTFSAKVAMDATGVTSAFSATGALLTVAAKTQTDSTTGAGTVAVAAGHDIEAVTFTTAANAITITDMATLRIAGPSVAGTNVTGTRKHSLAIVDSTAASSTITGGLIVATTLGTTATSVGIGGGAIYAGGAVVADSLTVNGATPASGAVKCSTIFTSGTQFWSYSSALLLGNSSEKLQLTFTQLGFGGLTSSFAGATYSGTALTFGLANNTAGGSVTCSGTLAVTGNTTLGTGTAIKNIRHGISGAMVLGAVTVTDTGCTANTRYFFAAHTLGTISIPGGYYASTRNASTSFVITSSQATETSTIDWIAIEV